MSPRRISQALLVLLSAAVILLFVDLGGSSIWDANEAFYVETPREMIERGDYVFPTFNYEPRLNKPVLSYWMVAGLYHAFGISVGVQRLGIALGAVLLIVVAGVLAWASRPGGSGPASSGRPGLSGPANSRLENPALQTALLAAAGLAVDPRLVMFARRIFIDIWISAFMALTLMFFALSERFPGRRRLFLVLMYVSVGLGVLTKGPVAAALPGLVFAIYLVAYRELRRVREMMIPAGILIVLAIVVPWYFALYQRDGWTYIASFFIGENIGRYTSGVGFQSPRGPLFYPPVVFGDAFPLSLFLIPAALLWWRTRDRAQSLLWLWILTIVGFFSFSPDKQDLYIFPIVPAVAALGAAAFVNRDIVPKTTWAVSALLACVTAIAGGGILYIFETAGAIYAVKGAFAIGIVAATGGIVALILVAGRRLWPAVLTVLATLAIVNWLFVVRVLPDFERYKPAPKLSEFLQSVSSPGDVIATYEANLPSLTYYLRRHVDVYYAPEPFVAAARAQPRMFGVLSEDDYARLQAELGGATCVLHRVSTFDVKLRNVLARDPLPQLLVISNHCEGR